MISKIDTIMKHYLYPSTLIVSEELCLVTTVLGSCVSVCLYDKVLKNGGINHFMLPFWNGKGLASPKYGNIAISQLIDKMTGMGSLKINLVAKIFGGANQSNSSLLIGERNVRIAKELLHHHEIGIIAESITGHIGRKIIYNTYSGEVRMKYVNSGITKI